MYQRRILPFYMTYPLPVGYREEDTAIRDLLYLQQLYPAEARKCQRAVTAALNGFDYEGSMIYDEYPDRWQLHKLSQDILELMKMAETKDNPEQDCPPEKWEGMSDLIWLVLLNELLQRRHTKRRGYLYF